MPLYTKLGDSGETMLYDGKRVLKSDPRIHAYGTIDELSAFLGILLREEMADNLREILLSIQHTLYVAGADLATPLAYRGEAKRITQEQVEQMERWIDAAEARVPPVTCFILPGGTRIGALLHQARTMCRRAERWLVALSRADEVNYACLRYLNRLGDYFFAAARVVNAEGGVEEAKA